MKKAVADTINIRQWESGLPSPAPAWQLIMAFTPLCFISGDTDTVWHRLTHLDRYLLHVGVAHGLCNSFAFVVAGSGAYRIHMAPVILTLRVDFRIYEREK